MLRIVRLRCRGCGSITCEKKPLGTYSSDYEGCEKEVSDETADMFFYYMVEMKPQLMRLGAKYSEEVWAEVIEFAQYIADLPAGRRWKEKWRKDY